MAEVEMDRVVWDYIRWPDFHKHLNMTPDEVGANFVFLEQQLCAAVDFTEAQLGFKLLDVSEFEDGPPYDVRQAVYMLAAHWFAQREVTIVGVSMTSVPFGYDDIIRSHRRYTFG